MLAPSQPRRTPWRIPHLSRTALSLLPTVGTALVLVVLGLVGHLTDWKISRLPTLWGRADPAEAADAKPKDDDKEAPADPTRMEFDSREALEKTGVKTEPAAHRAMTRYVTANGTIDYNRTRLVHLTTRVPGHVWRVYQRAGARVRGGTVLGLVDAAEVGRAKGDFLQALRTYELKSQLYDRARQTASSLPERTLREAEAAVAEARIRLFNAEQALANLGLPVDHERLTGLPEKEMARRVRFLGLEKLAPQLAKETTTANLIPLTTPFDGTVIRSDLVEGELVGTTKPQFSVADMSRLWLILDVRQEDAGLVREKQAMTFTPDGAPGVKAAGEVAWISTDVDPKTRTVRVRADVTNNGQLRVNSFGAGRIQVAQNRAALAVPASAVQYVPHPWVREHLLRSAAPAEADDAEAPPDPVVFVRLADGLSFQARLVRLGIQESGYVEVVQGLRAGEVVCTAASHVLRSELLRSEIGGED